MKKLFTVLLTMAMMLSFAACKDQNTPPDDSIIDVNLEILIEQDDSMINTYSLLAHSTSGGTGGSRSGCCEYQHG